MKTTAVVVTRADREIHPDTMRSLAPFDEVIVWDNSRAAKDVKVYGRFMGALLARNERVYVQDDDCVVDAAKVAASYMPGRIVCNMPADRRPEYAGTGVSLIGWGTVFNKSLVAPSFAEYLRRWPQDDLFERECDRLFTYVNRGRVVLVEADMRHLPSAHGGDRMGREARHRADHVEMRRRAAQLDDAWPEIRRSLGVEVV